MSKSDFASLTAGLLARKGEALPAAAGFTSQNVVSTNFGESQAVAEDICQDMALAQHLPKPSVKEAKAPDTPPVPKPSKRPKIVAQKSAEAAEKPAEPIVKPVQAKAEKVAPKAVESQAKPAPKSVVAKPSFGKRGEVDCEPCDQIDTIRKTADPEKRAAVTLRLDPTRYFCLKMAGARARRTNQDILTEALDLYLAKLSDEELKDCNCLRKFIREELYGV